jgi:hypothetical protein
MLSYTTSDPLTMTSEVIHRCPSCKWFRALSANPLVRRLKVDSPVYGIVTIERMAQLDVLNHECESYRVAQARLITVLHDLRRQSFTLRTDIERNAA